MPGPGDGTEVDDAGGMSRMASGGIRVAEGVNSVPAQWAMHPAHLVPCAEPLQWFAAE